MDLITTDIIAIRLSEEDTITHIGTKTNYWLPLLHELHNKDSLC